MFEAGQPSTGHSPDESGCCWPGAGLLLSPVYICSETKVVLIADSDVTPGDKPAVIITASFYCLLIAFVVQIELHGDISETSKHRHLFI